MDEDVRARHILGGSIPPLHFGGETMRSQFKVLYALGHYYVESWKKSDTLFCPHCGKPSVWEELGLGDYYYGPLVICSSCGKEWTWQLGNTEDYLTEQRLSHLRKLEEKHANTTKAKKD